ncbi:MAG: fasciclin domain-containing protein, partial [Rhizobiales bacterium]|nr:fasciclin domain-containing protein [Rhizobacter sp.]
MNRFARRFAPFATAIALAACASMSPPKTISQTAASDPRLSTLTRLLKEADLTATLDGAGPFTVFAPTDDAFKAVPAATLDALMKDK